MTKVKILFLTLLFCNVSYCPPALAQILSSTELINNAASYDQRLIEYRGEVIGDVMQRGSFVWINLGDGKNAIGIWLNKDLARPLRYYGNYKSEGDTVTVRGIFNRCCPEHGGDMDIHAQGLINIRSGKDIPHTVSLLKVKLALILGCVLISIWIFLSKYLSQIPSP